MIEVGRHVGFKQGVFEMGSVVINSAKGYRLNLQLRITVKPKTHESFILFLKT